MMKIVKWVGIIIVTLVVLAIGFYTYLIMSFDTETLPENHGKVNVELFMGEGGNQPLIVGLGGSEGGNAWASDYWKAQRDRFLDQGYAVLALGYFGAPDTPVNLDRIALEGVHQAILDAATNPNINQACIALIGGSKGAELALLMASHYSDIKTVVGIVPGNAVFPALTLAMNTASFSHNGAPFPFVPVPWSATGALIKGDLRAVWTEMLKNQEAVDKAVIKVENINGPILLVSAVRDEFWPSTEMSNAMEKRLANKEFPHTVEHLAIDGSHAAPLDHFVEIENFLKTNFMAENPTDCAWVN